MIRLLRCLMISGVLLAACGGSDDATEGAEQDDVTIAEPDEAEGSGDLDPPAAEDESAGAPADLSGVDACAILTDEAIDEALTAQISREVTITVERTPGTSDTEELGGPQRTCSFGVSEDGGYYSFDLRIVSRAYFDEQKSFAGESVEPVPEISDADDSFGYRSSEQVWIRQGDLAVSIENSSATRGLSIGLLELLLPALG